jgi:PAS domain S-box-containing protein
LLQEASGALVTSDVKDSIRILHVDDDTSILEISKQILLDLDGNFEFDHAFCVDEAFKKLSTGNYDVVVSDYDMPQKNGLQFLKELREQKYEIPFILFTGKGREEVAIEALNLGADGYYNKQGSSETVYGELAHGIKILTQRRKAEEKLKQSNKTINSIINSTNDAIFAFDSNWVVTYCNETFAKIGGLTQNEMLGKNARVVFANRIGTTLERNLTQVMEKKEPKTFEWNGLYEPKLWEFSVFPVYDGLTVFAKDITERKKAEEALLASEKKYRITFESTGTATVIIEEDTTLSLVNSEFEKLSGYSKKELENKKCWAEFVAKEDLEWMKERHKIRRNDEKAAPTQYEFRFKNKCGEIKNIFLTVSMIPGTKKSIASLLDVTERKKAEKALRTSEERYKLLADSLPEIVFEAANDGKLIYANDSAFEIAGYTKADFAKGLFVLDFIEQKDKQRAKENFSKILSNNPPQDNEYTFVRKDGSTFPVIIAGNPIIIEGKTVGLRGLVIDITKAKRAEQALENSEKRLKAITSSALDSIILVNDEGKIIYWNPAAEKMFGYGQDEVYDKSLHFLLAPQRFSDDAKRGLNEFKHTGEGYAVGKTLELSGLRKDGSEFPIELSLSRVQLNGKWHAEGIVRDISERKKLEKELKKNHVEMEIINEKIRVVGRLARHDVGNKLSAVNGYTYLLKKKHEDQADFVEGLSKIEQAVADSKKIFEFAKIYEQLGVEELTYVDLGKALDEAAALFSGLTIKVVNDCHGVSVLADSFLRQMFYNFIDNTRKHGGKATTIKVHYTQGESGGAQLIYEDDGVGISAENKSKLFKEGFSTGGSTGFGLFLISKMMDIYGWTITEEGESGNGAKFIIRLPPKKC